MLLVAGLAQRLDVTLEALRLLGVYSQVVRVCEEDGTGTKLIIPGVTCPCHFHDAELGGYGVVSERNLWFAPCELLSTGNKNQTLVCICSVSIRRLSKILTSLKSLISFQKMNSKISSLVEITWKKPTASPTNGR